MTDAASASADLEHRTLLDGCGLIERSERGKLALTGPEAAQFLNGQVTNELSTLTPGDGCYAAFLTHKGKMLGDMRILAVGETPGSPVQELLLDTERVALQALFDMIRRFKVGYQVELHKRTLESALFSLVGPETGELIRRVGPQASLLGAGEHDHLVLCISEAAVRLISTEEGVDLLCGEADAERVRKALIESGAQPVGQAAAEVLRVERGRPRYGLDIDESTIPQEAGLNERAVSFTKGCYVGQETVARLFYKGKANRHLRGLRLSGEASSGASLTLDGRAVGTLGSSVISPTFGAIGLALVRRDAELGAQIAVGEDGVSAEVVALPFTT